MSTYSPPASHRLADAILGSIAKSPPVPTYIQPRPAEYNLQPFAKPLYSFANDLDSFVRVFTGEKRQSAYDRTIHNFIHNSRTPFSKL
jgi:hypothetical protein